MKRSEKSTVFTLSTSKTMQNQSTYFKIVRFGAKKHGFIALLFGQFIFRLCKINPKLKNSEIVSLVVSVVYGRQNWKETIERSTNDFKGTLACFSMFAN